jgi:hypothetical protein
MDLSKCSSSDILENQLIRLAIPQSQPRMLIPVHATKRVGSTYLTNFENYQSHFHPFKLRHPC